MTSISEMTRTILVSSTMKKKISRVTSTIIRLTAMITNVFLNNSAILRIIIFLATTRKDNLIKKELRFPSLVSRTEIIH